jgi:hypothetical protein
MAALVAVALAGAVLVVTRGHHRRREIAVDVGDHGSSTTSSIEPTTVVSPPQTSTTSTTSTSAPVTTSTTTAVRPGGQTAIRRCAHVAASDANGLTAEVCQEGASVAGQPTTLHLTASDGDARVDDDCRSPDFEWGDGPTPRCMIACRMSDGPSQPSSIDLTRDHTYAQPGTYDVQVTVTSDCGDTSHGGESRTLTLQLVIKDPNQPPDGTG